MKKYIMTLTENERKNLGALTSKGKHRSQKILNALVLLGCDKGKFQKQQKCLGTGIKLSRLYPTLES